jgi:hypothetical protein
MQSLSRTAALVGAGLVAQAAGVQAQGLGEDSFKWYFGGQAGVTIFETPTQTRGAVFTAGGHFLITAKRTGLIVAVEEGVKTNQTSSYLDASAPGGVRQVTFNDIRKYSFTLVAFPFKTHVQPYLGVGFGILQTANEYPQGPFATQAEADNAKETANSLGSYGFGSFTAGVQARAGTTFVIFGQYQITTSPPRGKLFTGPSHQLMGGLRIGLGSSREEVTGGGY